MPEPVEYGQGPDNPATAATVKIVVSYDNGDRLEMEFPNIEPETIALDLMKLVRDQRKDKDDAS